MPFSILTNKKLHQKSLFAIRAVQAQRIFDLIQQNVQNPRQIMTVQNMESFIQRYYENGLNKGNKIINSLDKQGNKLNQQNFKFSLACQVKETQLNSLRSLVNYNQAIHNFFNFNFTKNNEQIDKWDIQEIFNGENVQKRKEKIKQCYQVAYNAINQINYNNFQQNIQLINYCYTIQYITDYQEDIKQVFNTFTNSIILNCLSQFLKELRGYLRNQNQIMNAKKRQQYYKNIAHLFGACKYSLIKQKIQNSCLFYIQTYQVLFQALKIQENFNRRIIIVCFANLSKYSQNFIQFIIVNSGKHLIQIINEFYKIEDPNRINYTLVCIKNIMKILVKKAQLINKDQIFKGFIQKINQDAIEVLKNQIKYCNQSQCIYILNQILLLFNYDETKILNIRLIFDIFTAPQQFKLGMGEAVLHVLQSSLLNKKQDFTQSIIKHQSFTNTLIQHISNSNSILFLPFIHIAYLLSFDYSSYLVQKGIFEKIINLMDGTSSVLLSLISDIIYNVVSQGLKNQKILQTLYQQSALFDRIIPFLLQKCIESNSDVNLLISKAINNTIQTPKNFNYFNKYVFFNVFKMIFCISACINRKNKKFAFSRKISLELLNSIVRMIKNLFSFQNTVLVKIILLQQIKFQNIEKLQKYEHQGKPFFKILDFILQELTYNAQNKPIQILRLIYETKKSFCNNLKSYISLSVLESQNIPIYVTLDIYITIGMQTKNFKRDIPHKFQFNEIKSYIKYLTSKVLQVKQTQISDFTLINGQKIVNMDVVYKQILKKILEHEKPFIISLNVTNIQMKKQKQMTKSFVTPFRNNGTLSTMRTNIYQNNNINNIGTTRVGRFGIQFANNNQSIRPTDNIRSSSSNIYVQPNYQRSYSPAFGIGQNNRNR